MRGCMQWRERKRKDNPQEAGVSFDFLLHVGIKLYISNSFDHTLLAAHLQLRLLLPSGWPKRVWGFLCLLFNRAAPFMLARLKSLQCLLRNA